MSAKESKLFQDPHVHYPIHDLNLDFSDYIRLSKQLVKETRQDLELNTDFIISANSPFEIRPARTKKPKYGALLIHGLLDSPFLARDIGKALSDNDVFVRAIALPGHGLVPGALLNVSYLDWLQAVRYGVASFKDEVEKIILVGYSTGATLSLLYDALEPNVIDRIVMIAPVVRINSHFAACANWHKLFSWAWPRAKWLHVRNEIDYVKYCSITFNAAYQVYLLAQAIKQFDQTLRQTPFFLMVSSEDEVVSTPATLDFFSRYANEQSRALIYSAKQIPLADPRIQMRSSFYPEMNIENFSHICLPFSPNNVHYGKHGYYAEASHVDSRRFTYGAENVITGWFYQLKYLSGLSKRPHARLSFNPDFNFFIQEMENFIFSDER